MARVSLRLASSAVEYSTKPWPRDRPSSAGLTQERRPRKFIPKKKLPQTKTAVQEIMTILNDDRHGLAGCHIFKQTQAPPPQDEARSTSFMGRHALAIRWPLSSWVFYKPPQEYRLVRWPYWIISAIPCKSNSCAGSRSFAFFHRVDINRSGLKARCAIQGDNRRTRVGALYYDFPYWSCH